MAKHILSAFQKNDSMVMKMRHLSMIVAIMATCTCFATATLAVEIKGAKPQDTKLKPKQKRAALPLSVTECKTLGGDVRIDLGDGVCSSSLFCAFFDENGIKHQVCIKEVK
jgi:hypothetical protein